MIRVELHVIGRVQIQVAIAVVIDKSRVRAPPYIPNRSRSRDLGEYTVPFIPVQHIRPVVGHVQIRIAVVVIVADSRAHAKAIVARASRGRDVGKGSISLVAIVRVGTAWAAITGHGRAVDNVQVEPPVAIVVEKGRARADGFHHVLVAAGPVDIAKI